MCRTVKHAWHETNSRLIFPTLLKSKQPTNHLDIPAKEILEEACRNYDGAILLVSHDRYFVSQVRLKLLMMCWLLIGCCLKEREMGGV